jgi:hypothetical protein
VDELLTNLTGEELNETIKLAYQVAVENGKVLMAKYLKERN